MAIPQGMLLQDMLTLHMLADVADQAMSLDAMAASVQVQGYPPRQADPLSELTVRMVTERVSTGPNTTHLHRGLRKWVQACGIVGDPDSVCISELLPHYASLLTHLDNQHSSQQLTATTAYRQLLALHGFLKTYQEVIEVEDGSVDYAAMLSSIDAVRGRFLQRSNIDAKTQIEGESLGGRKRKAAALPAWATAYRQHKTNSTDAAAVAAAAAVAGSTRGMNSSMLDLSGQQQQQPVPPFAPVTPALAAGATSGRARGAAAAAAAVPSSIVSMAHVLQQLGSDPSLGFGCGGICIRELQNSAACFGGVGLAAIPASLLLTSYIADVGSRAQQCLNARAAGQQGAGLECFELVQEVEGVLQVAGQPVVLQVFGQQRLQEMVDGLSRCKQQLRDTLKKG